MATIKYPGIVGQLRSDGRVQCGLTNANGGTCGSIIKNDRKNLRDHVNQHHRPGSSYMRRHHASPGVVWYCTCTSPNQKFNTFGDLDSHIRRRHNFKGTSGHIESDPRRTAFIISHQVANGIFSNLKKNRTATATATTAPATATTATATTAKATTAKATTAPATDSLPVRLKTAATGEETKKTKF